MKLTEARWQIVKALWQKHPATARNIMDGAGPSQLGLDDIRPGLWTRILESKAENRGE